jgi:hypothetical protein
MNRSQCPHCRQKLGNYLYAKACPHCSKVLEHNQAEPERAAKVWKPKPWPMRAFLRIVRLVES